MSWKNVEISEEKLMDVKGELHPSANLSLFIQNQMFDVDKNGFPVFTDKNIALINLLFDNDSSYTKGDAYEKETVDIFKNMFNQDKEVAEKSVNQAVYRVNKDNSTSLPTLSSEGDEKNGSKKRLTQQEITDRLGISDGILIEEDGSEESYLKGGSLLTAEAINRMIQQGIRDGVGRSFKELLLEGDPELVYLIAHAAEKEVNDHLGSTDELIKMNNFSFATKFCHHVSKRVGEEDQGTRYCIYDSVIHEFLPYFACMYLDAETLKDICDFKSDKSKRVTFGKKYVGVKNKIKEWKDDSPNKSGYEKYRNLYDAVLNAINNWREKQISFLAKQEGASQGDASVKPNRAMQHFFIDGQCEIVDYSSFDRFVWYFFKNQWRKKKAKELLKKWKKLAYDLW